MKKLTKKLPTILAYLGSVLVVIKLIDATNLFKSGEMPALDFIVVVFLGISSLIALYIAKIACERSVNNYGE